MRSVRDMLDLRDRVAIVTGGAGYLGLAFGEALGEAGARVVVVDRDAGPSEDRANDLRKRLGIDAIAIAHDLGATDAADRIVAEVTNRCGGLDILINNAAYTGASGLPGYAVPFDEQSVEAWQAALDVNLTAVFRLCRSARSALATSGHGVILNVASIYGVVGPNLSLYEGTSMGNPAAYAASKGGLVQLTRYLATTLAPRIRVNAISPGGIQRDQADLFRERYNALTPLGRLGREEDMKGIAALLASDASAYVTGQNIVVDGGWTAW